MVKVLKVLGKVIKYYAVVNTVTWALLGVGNYFDEAFYEAEQQNRYTLNVSDEVMHTFVVDGLNGLKREGKELVEIGKDCISDLKLRLGH